MRVKTRRQASGYKTRLEVDKLDLDNEIYISATSGGFYLYKEDVPALIKALRWAIR